MQIRHVINLHKGLTALVVGGLMLAYGNSSVGAWVYLALHGTYGVLWLLKERIFPDRQWQQAIGGPQAIVLFLMLGLYWLAPCLLIASGAVPPLPLLAGAIAINLLGVFLHFASDAQKHFVLKVQPGLIEDGFFARCRNTNYLGEVLIYLSFAMVAMHWLPLCSAGGFWPGRVFAKYAQEGPIPRPLSRL
jgi:protein-S-isoprenylcysteine O-methyltransferase Ste14